MTNYACCDGGTALAPCGCQGAILPPESDAPPCINCGRPLEGPTYTGDCASACDEDCYEKAWLKLSPNYKPSAPEAGVGR